MEYETLESLREWDGQSNLVHTDSLDGNESFEVTKSGQFKRYGN